MIKIQSATFNVQDEIDTLLKGRKDIGAMSIFVGLVRDFNNQSNDKKVTSLYLEHYPSMTERALQKIIDVATEKWQLYDHLIIHRIGLLNCAEPIVLVICCADKRTQAIKACEHVINQLKVNAPFWKKEHYSDGSEQWVEQQKTDLDILSAQE